LVETAPATPGLESPSHQAWIDLHPLAGRANAEQKIRFYTSRQMEFADKPLQLQAYSLYSKEPKKQHPLGKVLNCGWNSLTAQAPPTPLEDYQVTYPNPKHP
jgi:hypothetical protein